MLSTTTTASSTSMPSTITTPSSTMTLRVSPITPSSQKVPARMKGMPMAVSRAMREPRNSPGHQQHQEQADQGVVLHQVDGVAVGMVWSSTSTSSTPVLSPKALRSAM